MRPAKQGRSLPSLADGCLDDLTRHRLRELAEEWDGMARLLDPPAPASMPESTIHGAGDKRVDVSGRKIDVA